jgi:hypothetical protein
MSIERNRDILFPLVILVAVGVGAVIGGMLVRGGVSAPAPVVASSGDRKDFVDAVDALRQELVRSREKLDGLAGTPAASERVDASAASNVHAKDIATELHAVTAELAQAVEALRDAARRSGGDRAPLIAPASTPDSHLLDEIRGQPFVERNKTYLLWTYQQVMDRFGRPDLIGSWSNGLSWWYRGNSGKTVYFDFSDGRVSQVRADD